MNLIFMYTGNVKCHGCNRSGEEQPRNTKDSLCKTCRDNLTVGIELSKDLVKDDYACVQSRWYALQFYNSEMGGEDIENAIFGLMDALNRNVGFNGRVELTPAEATTQSKRVVMKKEYATWLKSLADALGFQQKKLKEAFAQIEIDRKRILADERNKIFNDGLEYGKSLLMQLNRNEISLAQFEEKNLQKY